jgi:uncharacterized repeat protein (TIGR04076 family)
MAEMYPVKVTVVSQAGQCTAGHKVGDSWTLESKSPGGVCLSALLACYPYVRILRHGGDVPWSKGKGVIANIACPDAANPVVFEMRRVAQP